MRLPVLIDEGLLAADGRPGGLLAVPATGTKLLFQRPAAFSSFSALVVNDAGDPHLG